MESQKKKETNTNTARNFCTPNFDVLNTLHLIDTSVEDVKQLGCTCIYIEVYGMRCVHKLVVANTMKPKWTYVSHNDVSVRWLKSYYLYSLPEKIIPQQDIQKRKKTGISIIAKI